MSLRYRILFICAFSFAALTAALVLFSKHTVQGAFTDLERSQLETTSRFIREVYANELLNLERLASDWAGSDFVNAAVESGEDILESGSQDDELTDREVSFLGITNAKGELLSTRYIDLDEKDAAEIPEPLSEFLGRDSHLRLHLHTDSRIGGLALVADKPLLVCSVPIQPGAEGGLIRGAVIAAREWKHSDFYRIALGQGLSIFHQPSDGDLAPDMREFVSLVHAADRMQVRLIGDSAVGAYMRLSDIYGQPSLVVRLTKRREAAGRAVQSSLRVAVFGIVAGAVLLISLAGLLEVTVLGRLRHLIREVKLLKGSDHLSDVSITVRGSDEVGKIAHGMRYLLDALRTNKTRWNRAEKRLQEILEICPVPMLLAEPTRHRLYRINQTALQVLQCDRKHLTGRKIRDVIVPAEEDASMSGLLDELGEEPHEFRAQAVRGDGSRIGVVVRAAAMRNGEGDLLIFAFTPTDG